VRAWEFSRVFRLDTGTTRFYFKSRPPAGAAEAPVTRLLAERHPAWMPDVIAIEAERRWLLMREAPGQPLLERGDLGRWEAAAAAIAGIQIAWAGATDALSALGVPRLTLRRLESEVAPLVDDAPALQPGGEDSLTDAQVAALRARAGELQALCRELDAFGIPESIEHGDLWAANVFAGDRRLALLDWEDANVAHPFITPSLLLLSVSYAPALADHDEARRRIRDAYLAPWTAGGPLATWPRTRVARAFDLAARAAMLHYAVRFRLGLPLIETSHHVRGFVPYFAGKLLAP
jgi:hypothetical protein